LNDIDTVLQLDDEKFSNLISNSLSSRELGSISEKQLERRGEIIEGKLSTYSSFILYSLMKLID
jgi:hypothetical protein